jgi:hypothetical protein
MKSAKTLAIMACACLLSVGVAGSVRRALAQDSDESDQGAVIWSSPDASSADESTGSKNKEPPLDISGCWYGGVNDKTSTGGVAGFKFVQNDSKISTGSELEFYWTKFNYIIAKIKGTVSATGIKFSVSSGGCSIKGSATGDESELMGKATFSGKCAKDFQDAIFSVTPQTCE